MQALSTLSVASEESEEGKQSSDLLVEGLSPPSRSLTLKERVWQCAGCLQGCCVPCCRRRRSSRPPALPPLPSTLSSSLAPRLRRAPSRRTMDDADDLRESAAEADSALHRPGCRPPDQLRIVLARWHCFEC